MPLAFAVFFIGVLHGYLLIHEILAVHIGYGFVGSFKIGERNEAIALGKICVVAGHLRHHVSPRPQPTEPPMVNLPLEQQLNYRSGRKYHKAFVRSP